jgi:phosphate transport system substrate-binding protein
MSLALLVAAAIAPAPVPLVPHAVAGTVAVWTSAALAPKVARIARAVERKGVHVVVKAPGSDVAIAGLYTGLADIALIGRKATPSEKQAFEWIRQRPPAEQPLMHGSAGTPAHSPALAILVNRANPLAALSSDQLVRLFTATGPQFWRDYGVRGPLGARRIHLHIPDAASGTGRFFRDAALGGRNQLAWSRIAEHRQNDNAGAAVARAVAADPAALGIGEIDTAGNVRVVPLQVDGTPVAPSAATVHSGRYPLSRTIFAYFDQPKEAPVRPEIQAFLDSAEAEARR